MKRVLQKVVGIEQLSLPLTKEVFVVHCFFAYFRPKCKHIVRADDPYKAHDLMEQHYTEKHDADIDRILRGRR